MKNVFASNLKGTRTLRTDDKQRLVELDQLVLAAASQKHG
jgi:hypothetical protein